MKSLIYLFGISNVKRVINIEQTYKKDGLGVGGGGRGGLGASDILKLNLNGNIRSIIRWIIPCECKDLIYMYACPADVKRIFVSIHT